MFGTLSSRSRETAITFRSSAPVVWCQPRRSKTVFSGWKASGTNAGSRRSRPEARGAGAGGRPAPRSSPRARRASCSASGCRARGRVDGRRTTSSGCSLPGRRASAPVGEDLGATARERPEPRGLQLAQHRLVRDAGELRHVVHFAGREELQVDVRHRVVELRDDLDVVAEVDVRALAPDHVDLGEPGQLALAHRILDELLRRVRVRARLLLRDGEGAELVLPRQTFVWLR